MDGKNVNMSEISLRIDSIENIPLRYSQSIAFLLENLPTREMKTTVSKIYLNPNTPKRTLTCLDENEIIGVSIGGPLDSNRAYLQFMYVLPEYRRKGVGKFLLDAFEQREIKRNISTIEADTYDPLVADWMVRQGYQIFRREGNVANHVKYF